MSKYAQLRRRVEALVIKHTETFDVLGHRMTMDQIKILMRELDGKTRGVPAERATRE